ncbi:ABC-F family ATP-binding cassette domain-containing protein [Pediococcus cellicola]|uniref:ABC transporter ATP-binding protein n=1 Tax=Pediococcus cellicola TaxID=319652 RepID=A0A0R2IT90_9LACO|nr:ABC-F family ATP-binding cassette domain-containing protein [Pediococcus cellicola]KRN66726.1 ABC transporter ATP-binding protein [Pediococcus cellicola]GEL14630.1 ABC transporter ATP-binding protein [Pediococcus cellicola]
MILLQAQNVSREFSGDPLFANVTFDIQDQDRIGLVGRNGAGKTTLLKMLIGQTVPDSGQITSKKGLSIGYLAQNQGLDTQKTIWNEMLSVFQPLIVLENEIHEIEHELSSEQIIANQTEFTRLSTLYDQKQQQFKAENGFGYQAEIRGVLHGFGFEEATYKHPVENLSGGQKTKLALAKLLLEQHDLLVLDEPTNHLDMSTLNWLENYIKSYHGALLIVSHDRYFLDHVVTRVLDLDRKTVTNYIGNYSNYIDQKASRLKTEWKAYEKQQTKINKLEDFVNRNIVRASTTKRAQSRRKQLEKMTVLERPTETNGEMHFHFAVKQASGNVVLTVTDAAIGYDQHILSSPINIELNKHHVLGIVGPNGIGKSTLLKSILGQIPFLRGTYKLGTGVQIGYYDQEQHNLDDKKTVLNELWDEHPLVDEKDIRSLLGSFLFSGDDVAKQVKNLSGGERARLLLTKLTMQRDNFLILDEPTNHLDIDSREVLENALNEFDGTVLFVSHDRYFINRVATEILEISTQGSQLFLGDYDYYLMKQQEQLANAQEAYKNPEVHNQQPDSNKQNYLASKEKQKSQRKLQREIDKLETELDHLADQEKHIQTQMADPTIFNDHLKLEELQKQLTLVQTDITQTENAWTQKSEELEEN